MKLILAEAVEAAEAEVGAEAVQDQNQSNYTDEQKRKAEWINYYVKNGLFDHAKNLGWEGDNPKKPSDDDIEKNIMEWTKTVNYLVQTGEFDRARHLGWDGVDPASPSADDIKNNKETLTDPTDPNTNNPPPTTTPSNKRYSNSDGY